ncbi:MAG: hypothetical protein MJ107_05745, partial [Lachnospiraceae bacterium]|nr:hypothetical protein [Lachnospiraceae bacterium]
ISKSKSMLVWQTGNNVNASENLMVMNLNTGQINTTVAPEGEYIKPLAFMNEDLIYGLAEKRDVVTDGAGRTTFPMYELKIQNEYGEQLKTYAEPGIYVSNVWLKDNLLSMERVVKSDSEELKYLPYENDYMTNNQTPKQRQNVIQTAVDDLYETIVRIKFSHDTKGKIIMLSPETVIYEGSKELYLGKNITDKNHYYVYYKGSLQTISTKASNAVTQANNNYGTVVDDEGYYVWIRANRALRNQIMDLSIEPNIEGDVDQVAWCLDRMLEYEGAVRNTEYLFSIGETVLSILEEALSDYNVCDLTGCSLDSILYYVNRDIPVLVLMNDGKAYLIIGYNQLSIVVLEPEKGWYKMGINEAQEMFEANGNQFITYVPDK